jgi:EpsI family protein
MNFLSNKYARLLTLVLLVQAGAYYAVAMRTEITPAVAPLSQFPTVSKEWRMTRDLPLEKETLDVLKADDTMNREYTAASGASAYFFIAFFKTQRKGQAPHSPKNCLPGAGWTPLEDTKISIPVPGWPEPIVTNKFVVQHGSDKSVTLYWYQSHNRVIASEYSAKFWLVADAIRYQRSDTAIVKVVVPVQGNNVDAATAIGINLVQSVFPDVMKQLPL